IRNHSGHRDDADRNTGSHPLSGADPWIVYSIGSHAFLWNIRYADHGSKLSVLRSFHYDLHLFSGYGKSVVKHGDSIMQTTAFPYSGLMVSGQMFTAKRKLACISCRGNRDFARCSRHDGLVSSQMSTTRQMVIWTTTP